MPEAAAAQAPTVITPRSRFATSETAAVDSPSEASNSPETAADKIAAAEEPSPRPETTTSTAVASIPLRNTKIIAMAPLRGSLESLIRQNEKTDADNLERIEDDTDLHNRIANGSLVPVPSSEAITVNSNLPADRRYCRPWTAKFLSDLGRDHQAEFHHSFEVSSAVRTVEYQKRLMRTNGNAAPAEGDVASPHLTGATIDIAKSGLGRTELYWMRNRLNTLQNEGKIDVEEEFRQACFHITVYKSYVGTGPLHKPRHKAPAPPADGADSSSEPPATGQ